MNTPKYAIKHLFFIHFIYKIIHLLYGKNFIYFINKRYTNISRAFRRFATPLTHGIFVRVSPVKNDFLTQKSTRHIKKRQKTLVRVSLRKKSQISRIFIFNRHTEFYIFYTILFISDKIDAFLGYIM